MEFRKQNATKFVWIQTNNTQVWTQGEIATILVYFGYLKTETTVVNTNLIQWKISEAGFIHNVTMKMWIFSMDLHYSDLSQLGYVWMKVYAKDTCLCGQENTAQEISKTGVKKIYYA